MPDFYVLPAHVIENVEPVAAVGERNAAVKAASRDGVTAGRVAVISADAIKFKTLESSTTLDATD